MADLKMLWKLNDICLYVPDLDLAIEFYTKKMGFNLVSRRDIYYAEFEFSGTSLTIWREDEVYQAVKKEHMGGDGHHFMLAIKVPTLQDVDDLYEELSARGVECISEPKTYHWNCRAVYFKDLCENIWEIFAITEDYKKGLDD